jgi:diadenosine tetraphosphatase ApaH/serine/threonine PP2A family protein phosphatase
MSRFRTPSVHFAHGAARSRPAASPPRMWLREWIKHGSDAKEGEFPSKLKFRRTIVVGDVHGCFPELKRLLRSVQLSLARGDRLCLVGDLVGKGQPGGGARAVRLARTLQERWGRESVLAVLGNHDLHLLERAWRPVVMDVAVRLAGSGSEGKGDDLECTVVVRRGCDAGALADAVARSQGVPLGSVTVSVGLEELARDRLLEEAGVGPESENVVATFSASRAADALEEEESGVLPVASGDDDADLLSEQDEDLGPLPELETPLAPGADLSTVSRAHYADGMHMTAQDWDWLSNLPLAERFEQGGKEYLLVHAGLIPGRRLSEHTQADDRALTHMRNVIPQDEGKWEPSEGGVNSEGRAWAAEWNGPEHVIFGHDAVRRYQEFPFATGLDTGACYGTRLSALILPAHALVSVRSHQYSPAPGADADPFVQCGDNPGSVVKEV